MKTTSSKPVARLALNLSDKKSSKSGVKAGMARGPNNHNQSAVKKLTLNKETLKNLQVRSNLKAGMTPTVYSCGC